MKNSYRPITIIVADDHDIFRDGFHTLLKGQDRIRLLAEAANGRQLVELARQWQPDVILTDIKMPVMDGVEASRIIKANQPEIGIIALSMFNDERLILDMMEAGAKGYLLKEAKRAQVIEAIIAVARMEPYYCIKTSMKLSRIIAEGRLDSGEQFLRRNLLTEKEKEIMRLICREFSNKEISTELHLSIRTIEGYRERILEKTAVRNTAGIVVYSIMHDIYHIEKGN